MYMLCSVLAELERSESCVPECLCDTAPVHASSGIKTGQAVACTLK